MALTRPAASQHLLQILFRNNHQRSRPRCSYSLVHNQVLGSRLFGQPGSSRKARFAASTVSKSFFDQVSLLAPNKLQLSSRDSADISIVPHRDTTGDTSTLPLGLRAPTAYTVVTRPTAGRAASLSLTRSAPGTDARRNSRALECPTGWPSHVR